MLLSSLALALLAAAMAAPAAAVPAPAPGPVGTDIDRDGVPQIEARLLRSGSRVGVLFDLAAGWHVYWRSSGDTGLPPELSWHASRGSVGPIRWPVPEAFQAGGSEPGAASYGYEHQVLLASDLLARDGDDPSEASLRADVRVDVDILACEYECVPVELRLVRAAGQALPDWSAEREEALFEQYAARLPDDPSRHGLEISVAWSQSAIRPGDVFRGAIGIRSCTREDTPCETWKPATPAEPGGAFFPDDMETVSLRSGRPLADRDDTRLHWLELRGEADPEEAIESQRITGLLAIENDAGLLRHVEVDVPFPTAARGAEVVMLGRHWAPPVALLQGMGLVEALLLALLGGLVLNGMPCVLPVLAIKVFSLSEMAEAAHTGRAEPLRHGIAYTAGIVASMLALGGGVVLLRAAGHSVGWGFQFQEPVYVAAISAVLVAFALNLFGTFEIHGGAGPLARLGQEATGARRSFFEGLLAVALATPCSAPFLGTAVGFAFASPPGVILAIFVAIGLGLAAPFALVAMVPAWARFMPRSGAWMQTVRSGLGFALLATVLWLLWIFGGSAGADGIVTLTAFLLLLAFSLWCFGLLQRSAHPRMTVAAGLAVLLVGGAGLNAVHARVETASTAEEVESSHAGPARTAIDDAWEPWSPEAVEAQRAQGRPVFVRFTADWCITCKVNERVALADDRVHEAFRRGDFALLVGDWTQRDERIRSELSRHGRAGVPLYLVYGPDDADAPRMLPELLTPDLVLAALGTPEARPSGKP